MLTALIIVAGPHLTRPVRRFGWLIVILVAISGFALAFGYPSDALGGVGLGMLVGGGVLLVFGSPKGYPATSEVQKALADLGVELSSIALTPDQSWGTRRYDAVSVEGAPIEIKAYGRDATDSQVASRAWHQLWYRNDGRHFAYSRRQAVEHEALAIFMASRAGVATPEVLAVGIGGDDTALLATTDEGSLLTEVDVTADHLAAVWRQVVVLHDSGIAHGQLGLAAVSVTDDGMVLRDFDAAAFSAPEIRIHVDVVSLLFESAVALGPDEAAQIAQRELGDERLAAVLPYLQVPALSHQQKKMVAKPKQTIAQLRTDITEATGAEDAAPAKLRRVRWQDLITPALSLIAAYALIGMLSDIDFEAVWEVVRDAEWFLIVIGFLIGQLVFIPEATGMLFATGYPLPMRPLTVLQLSVKWIGLAIPSAAGRITMNTLFLRKYGVSPTVALTQGAIDGVSGFVVEAMILVIAFIASPISLDLDTSEIRWGLILLIVVLLIVGTVVAILRVARLREKVLPVVGEAWGLLRDVLKDPKRGLGLLASNLASRLVLAIVLWFVLQAIDAPLPLLMCLVVTVATNLLAGLVPIPGGIGVAEAVLTSFLVLAGLPSEEAFAGAVVFRIATFYIPAGEGFFAMRWLQTGGYL